MNWIAGIQRAIQYIENHLTDHLEYADIAKEAACSSSYFQRIFGIICGVSLGEYIRNRRMTLAGQELSHTEARVTEVAAKYGYESLESFSRAFSKFHGIAPSEAKKSGVEMNAFTPILLEIDKKGGDFFKYKVPEENLEKAMQANARYGMKNIEECVLDWLEKTAKEKGEKIAFSDREEEITFGEILVKAQAIGAGIIDCCPSKGVLEYKRPIAVMMGKSVKMPVAFLGVVYSGRPYAPVDIKLPKARIEKILKTLKPMAIITDAKNLETVKELNQNIPIFVMETFTKEYSKQLQTTKVQEQLKSVREKMLPTDPLYIIFTSGSTGTPKGVITSHESLMHYINAYSRVMGIEENDILGNQSPLDYIAAIRDIYLPLKHGCSTVLIPKEYFMEPDILFEYLNDKKVTSVAWSVSAFTIPVSLGAFAQIRPEYLKKVCFSGSVMPCKCLKIWQENLPEARFVNQYGPTETTASCTYYVVDHLVSEEEVLPIGKPYDNYRVFLLKEDGTEAGVLEEGEICVAGPILALGYYNDPERTKDTFIQNPLHNSYRDIIYKTGDIGMMREDGLLTFHGRKDRQVKHMGHRVELDEIEYAVNQLEQVAESCCIYQKEKECLVLFYTGNADVKTVALELRKLLPGFMVPRKIKALEIMPKLDNGKIDMKELEKKLERNGDRRKK